MRTLVVTLVSLFFLACQAEAPDGGEAGPAGGEDAAAGGPETAAATLEEELESPEVARLYRAMMDSLAPDGGWERTRYLEFDWLVARPEGAVRRSHRWDRSSGRYRVEAPVGDDGTMVALFDVTAPTESARVWVDGTAVTDPARADSLADRAHGIFINDSYWLLMPFKWADAGVTTAHLGTMQMWGKSYEVVELTFEQGIGRTPQNRYRAFVDPASSVMEIWQYYGEASDTTPGFTMAWTDWRDYGPILLSSRRETEDGEARIWFENIRAETSVPDGAFAPPGEG